MLRLLRLLRFRRASNPNEYVAATRAFVHPLLRCLDDEGNRTNAVSGHKKLVFAHSACRMLDLVART